VLSVVGVLAIFAPLVTSYDPARTSLKDTLLPPWGFEGGVREHFLGTDQVGRDIYARIAYGARVSLGVAAASILIGGIVGSLLGLLAGFHGKIVETLVMRVTDILLALPIFLLAIVVAASLGPSTGLVIGIITALIWPYFARQIRGETMSLKHAEFVIAARALGGTDSHIIVRHILPNVLPTIIIFATLQVNLVIVTEASLSFLGVGIPPPSPSWGRMVSEGREVVVTSWWISAIPGIVISVVVLCFGFLGDTLRDKLDPILRQR
jgi:peptide/nickel transport system permease protein